MRRRPWGVTSTPQSAICGLDTYATDICAVMLIICDLLNQINCIVSLSVSCFGCCVCNITYRASLFPADSPGGFMLPGETVGNYINDAVCVSVGSCEFINYYSVY